MFVERPVVSSQFLWNALYNYRGEGRVPVTCPGEGTRLGGGLALGLALA